MLDFIFLQDAAHCQVINWGNCRHWRIGSKKFQLHEKEIFPDSPYLHNKLAEFFIRFIGHVDSYNWCLSLYVGRQHVTIIGECQFIFPCCIGNWVTFPFYEILISLSSLPMSDNWLDSIEFISFKEFWGWSREIHSMGFVFYIGPK